MTYATPNITTALSDVYSLHGMAEAIQSVASGGQTSELHNVDAIAAGIIALAERVEANLEVIEARAAEKEEVAA